MLALRFQANRGGPGREARARRSRRRGAGPARGRSGDLRRRRRLGRRPARALGGPRGARGFRRRRVVAQPQDHPRRDALPAEGGAGTAARIGPGAPDLLTIAPPWCGRLHVRGARPTATGSRAARRWRWRCRLNDWLTRDRNEGLPRALPDPRGSDGLRGGGGVAHPRSRDPGPHRRRRVERRPGLEHREADPRLRPRRRRRRRPRGQPRRGGGAAAGRGPRGRCVDPRHPRGANGRGAGQDGPQRRRAVVRRSAPPRRTLPASRAPAAGPEPRPGLRASGPVRGGGEERRPLPLPGPLGGPDHGGDRLRARGERAQRPPGLPRDRASGPSPGRGSTTLG